MTGRRASFHLRDEGATRKAPDECVGVRWGSGSKDIPAQWDCFIEIIEAWKRGAFWVAEAGCSGVGERVSPRMKSGKGKA